MKPMVRLSVAAPLHANPFSAGAALFSPAAELAIFTPNLRRPTGAVIDYVRRLVESSEPIIERRGAPRLSVTFSARAVMLDETRQRVGDDFFVVVRNISAIGLGLL